MKHIVDYSAIRGKIKVYFSKYKYLMIIIFVGIIILSVPSGEKKEQIKENNTDEFDLASFEKRIERVLESGEGVGRVKLVLTVKTSSENVYAEETRINTREETGSGESYDYNKDSDRKPSILSDGNGGETAVVIKKIYPQFLGAAVVCDGADNPGVRLYITEAVSSLTGISTDRITIIKMKR